jgi:hypothetical protein
MLVTAACGGDGAQQSATETESTTRTTTALKTTKKIPEVELPLSPGKYTTTKFEPALTFRVVDKGWVNLGPEYPDSFFIGFGAPEFPLLLGFATPLKVYDPERLPKRVAVPEPEDWVAVTVGGVSGVRFETEMSSAPRDYPEDCGDTPCIPVWQMEDDSEWIMFLGAIDQITILDVGDKTVIIDVLAPEDDIEKRLPKAQKVVDTVEWKGAS